jgi:hypothetical protein
LEFHYYTIAKPGTDKDGAIDSVLDPVITKFTAPAAIGNKAFKATDNTQTFTIKVYAEAIQSNGLTTAADAFAALDAIDVADRPAVTAAPAADTTNEAGQVADTNNSTIPA